MPPPPEALVTVARFDTVGEALVARSRLAAEGIRALVVERDVLRLDLFSPRRAPPVRLQVLEGDREAAAKVLDLPAPAADGG